MNYVYQKNLLECNKCGFREEFEDEVNYRYVVPPGDYYVPQYGIWWYNPRYADKENMDEWLNSFSPEERNTYFWFLIRTPSTLEQAERIWGRDIIEKMDKEILEHRL